MIRSDDRAIAAAHEQHDDHYQNQQTDGDAAATDRDFGAQRHAGRNRPAPPPRPIVVIIVVLAGTRARPRPILFIAFVPAFSARRGLFGKQPVLSVRLHPIGHAFLPHHVSGVEKSRRGQLPQFIPRNRAHLLVVRGVIPFGHGADSMQKPRRQCEKVAAGTPSIITLVRARSSKIARRTGPSPPDWNRTSDLPLIRRLLSPLSYGRKAKTLRYTANHRIPPCT